MVLWLPNYELKVVVFKWKDRAEALEGWQLIWAWSNQTKAMRLWAWRSNKIYLVLRSSPTPSGFRVAARAKQQNSKHRAKTEWVHRPLRVSSEIFRHSKWENKTTWWSIQTMLISTKKWMVNLRLKKAFPVWIRLKLSKCAILTNQKVVITISTPCLDSTDWDALKFSVVTAIFVFWDISSQTDSQECMCHHCPLSRNLGRARLSSLKSGAFFWTCS